MLRNLIDEVEAMSAEEKQALLAMEFSPEIEKQASADLNAMEMAEALYAIGSLSAEQAYMAGNGQEKIAAETVAEYAAAEAELDAVVESCVESLGIANCESEAELHKEAQAAAAFLFQGFVDTMEKIAAGEEAAKPGFKDKMKGWSESAKKKMSEGAEKIKGAAGKAATHVKANKGKYGAGIAGLAAAGYGAKKYMDKKASEFTVAELSAISELEMVVEGGCEELSKIGSAAGDRMKDVLQKAKTVAKHPVSTHAAAGAAGGGSALLARHLMNKKKEK